MYPCGAPAGAILEELHKGFTGKFVALQVLLDDINPAQCEISSLVNGNVMLNRSLDRHPDHMCIVVWTRVGALEARTDSMGSHTMMSGPGGR